MDLDVFVASHRPEWDRLRQLSRRGRSLTGAEIDEFVASYQRVTAHLATLQAGGLDPALTARLSSQLATARAVIGGAQSSTWRTVGRFFAISFPATVYRARWWWLGSTVGSIIVAVLVGWRVAGSPALQDSLLPRSDARDLVRHQFAGYYSQYDARSFAAQVWTNNAMVAAETVVFGILLFPVLLVLYQNAVNAGLLGGLMTAYGKANVFWSLILPHGMLELSVVFLAAGAGLRLGWTWIDPGPLPRSRALAQTGRSTITIALGAAAALAVSGVIEAFVTPSGLPTWLRIGIGAVAEIAFLGYALILGRRAVRAGESGDIAEAPDANPVSA